jgi:transcriptional regulatory protein RtcR
MKTVVFGFYGSTLDAGKSAARWEKWRPSLALCRHEDLAIDRFELLYSVPHGDAAELLAADIRQVSPETELRLHRIPLQDPWDFEEVFSALHDFSRGYRFEPEKNRYLVHITTGSHVMQICWFLLTESRHFPAQLLQTSPGAAKRSERGTYRIIDLDLSRYDKLARRFRAEREESVAVLKFGIPTRNAAFNRLIESIEHVALRSREPLLLTGPTGAGKSQLAKQIYELKRARQLVAGPLVEVNCATVRGDGAMSTLFGHKRGAFTGAATDRKGLLRAADRGLLFLDEVGELGLDEQAMLLRAIETKQFFPVGADAEVSSDFQLIAGTNRDLKAALQSGRFREDLLARINVWTFELPGLARRAEDIEPNLDFELGRTSQRLGHNVTMNREARGEFLKFATSSSAVWSANFRDFCAAVLRMATLAPAGRIDVATVRAEKERLLHGWSESSGAARDELADVLPAEQLARLDPFDRVQLSEVLRVCHRSQSLSEAGRELFAVSRTQRTTVNDADRLRKYLARFGLEWDQLQAPER